MTEFTPNLNLELPDFNVITWHDQVNDNFTILDAAITALDLGGTWENATIYIAGDKVVDETSAIVYICQVNHTSASTGTFAADRLANPTYWHELGAIGSFLSLSDVAASSYAGQANRVVTVNPTETGLIFTIPSGGAASRFTRTVTTAGAALFDATTDDILFINKTVGAATVVNLPVASTRGQGRMVTIIDAKWDADVNNITITPNGAETILGLATWVIGSIGGYVNLIPHPSNGKWVLC
jgi:hypothetical protein